MLTAIQALDWRILHWIQATLRCGALDFLLPKLTMLGNGGAVWLAAAAALCLSKRYRRYGLAMLGALAVGVLIGNVLLKPLVARPRPCWLEETVLLLRNPTDASFPSGHTLSSVIGAYLLTAADRRFGWIAIPLAAAIGFSRLYLFVHFPTDVLASVILGLGIGAVGALAARSKLRLGRCS